MINERLTSLTNPARTLCASILISCLFIGLSSPATAFRSSDSTPYGEGDRDHLPSAAARITGIECIRSPRGLLLTFDVRVFETSWTPVYSVFIEDTGDGYLQPVNCPSGWTMLGDGAFSGSDLVVYSTDSDPILPGQMMAGFSLLVPGGKTSLRWYPTDASGELVGKVTREDFSCPTSLKERTWGGVKSLYR
jgi:hypothetical protein